MHVRLIICDGALAVLLHSFHRLFSGSDRVKSPCLPVNDSSFRYFYFFLTTDIIACSTRHQPDYSSLHSPLHRFIQKSRLTYLHAECDVPALSCRQMHPTEAGHLHRRPYHSGDLIAEVKLDNFIPVPISCIFRNCSEPLLTAGRSQRSQ